MTKRKNTLNPKVSIDGTDEVALVSSHSSQLSHKSHSIKE